MNLESRVEFVPGPDANDALAVCFSADFGLGVSAQVDVSQGGVLDHFTGRIGSEITQHSLQVRPGLHISDTRFIGYLSHGCDPNCRLDMDRFQLIAVRDIAADELLTIDYAATEDVLHVQFACLCGAHNCRDWITGRHDPVNAAGAAFLASFPSRALRA